MPWTARSFAKHNHKLKGKALSKAASMATAMVKSGVDEGIAIATANKRAKAASEHSSKRRKALYGD
jgi:uncharacterized protein YdaT